MVSKVEVKEVISLLKKNGGPLALRAALVIKELSKSMPKKKPGELHPHHKRIVLLFQKRLNKSFRDPDETRVFNEVKDLINEADLDKLERFYRQPEPKSFHKQLSRRKGSPITLMRAYIAQADLADQWCEMNPPAPDPKKPLIPEPKNWQQFAPGNLGERSWYFICKQYPAISKDISEQVKNNCRAS